VEEKSGELEGDLGKRVFPSQEPKRREGMAFFDSLRGSLAVRPDVRTKGSVVFDGGEKQEGRGEMFLWGREPVFIAWKFADSIKGTYRAGESTFYTGKKVTPFYQDC